MGRITCYAIEDGVSRKDLREAINKCLNDGEETCDEVREENKKWRQVAGAVAVVASILVFRQGLIVLAAQIAARAAVSKAFKELMKKIVEDELARKKAFEELLKKIKESEIILVP